MARGWGGGNGRGLTRLTGGSILPPMLRLSLILLALLAVPFAPHVLLADDPVVTGTAGVAGWTTFLQSFGILFREGLEALLLCTALAAATLKACVTAYRKGEREYRKGLLDAGRLADVYVHQRLALGDDRAAAVQVLEGQLAVYSSTAVDVNRLVRTYHAARLLADEPGVKADVPYGHYRDAWSKLVSNGPHTR